LDHHRAFLDNFAANLSQNKREAIRHEERMARLQRKYQEEAAQIAEEVAASSRNSNHGSPQNGNDASKNSHNGRWPRGRRGSRRVRTCRIRR
jgi:hypothetical protein